VSPLAIIHLYSHRFRIECTFRTLKQEIGGFSYHFWTKAMNKLSHFRKKQDQAHWMASCRKKTVNVCWIRCAPQKCMRSFPVYRSGYCRSYSPNAWTILPWKDFAISGRRQRAALRKRISCYPAKAFICILGKTCQR